MSGVDRRGFLKGAAAAGASMLLPASVSVRPARAQSPAPVKVYVVVIDGLRPDEVALMPQLSALTQQGTYWPQARAHMIAETTPNHVSMLTGMQGNRHGMPGNAVPVATRGAVQLGDQPRYLKADTLFTLARRQSPGLVTASVVSKTYLVAMSMHDRDGDGEPDAGYVYRPNVIIPESNHEPDDLVMAETLRVSSEMDPDFLFVNLGDVDRSGHADPSGNAEGPTGRAPLFRTAVLENTDNLLRSLVQMLQQDGRWAATVLIVTADHSMDWSLPDRIVNLFPAFEADELLAGETLAADNGGVGLYVLRSPAEPRAGERLARMREIALGTDGVEEALYINPNPADAGEAHWVGAAHPDWGLAGAYAGDLIVTVEPGWRVTEPSATSNPIPGNHGHVVTLPMPMVITGGWDGVVAQQVDPAGDLAPGDRDPTQAQNIDIAPTVAWLLGLQPPAGDFDGRVLAEAFSQEAPADPGTSPLPVPLYDRLFGSDRLETATRLSLAAFPQGSEGLVVATASDFPDALAAVPLAVTLNAPLLLAPHGGLPPLVADEVRRLAPDQAIVVGGESALSAAVEEDLRGAGAGEVIRIGGATRFDTARLIAAEVGAARGEAVLVSGTSFADALAAGPVAAATGRPILLTAPSGLPDESVAAIRDEEITRVLIAGGPAAVPVVVEEQLRADGIVVERLGGVTRYDTARLLTERAVREGAFTDRLFLASGADFPDALAAGPLAGALGGVLLLVPPDGLAPTSRTLLEARSDEFVHVWFIGGFAALTSDLERDVKALFEARRSR